MREWVFLAPSIKNKECRENSQTHKDGAKKIDPLQFIPIVHRARILKDSLWNLEFPLNKYDG